MKSNLEPTVLKVRQHEVFITRPINPLTVMVTGDWHISPAVSERQYGFIKEAISVCQPDLIILQGDMVDSPLELTRESSLRKLIRTLRLCSEAAPTALVLGGHDYVIPGSHARVMLEQALPRWQTICAKCGVRLLNNEWFELDGIRIYGMLQDEKCVMGSSGTFVKQDNSPFTKMLEKCDFEFDSSRLNWFAAHAPMVDAENLKLLDGFDVLSFGHTHGGIVPRGIDEVLEKTGTHRGIVSPNFLPFPANARGAMDLPNGAVMVVNPGMVGAQHNAPKAAQRLNFVKAAEVSVVKITPIETEL